MTLKVTRLRYLNSRMTKILWEYAPRPPYHLHGSSQLPKNVNLNLGQTANLAHLSTVLKTYMGHIKVMMGIPMILVHMQKVLIPAIESFDI